MKELTIKLIEDKGKKNIIIEFNGRTIPGVKGIKLNYEEGKVILDGIICKTDRSLQYYVDPETKDTATEKISFLSYFNEDFVAQKTFDDMRKIIDLDLLNIYKTSRFNALKYLEERGLNEENSENKII